MNENIVTFLNKLAQDEAAQKMFSACRDPEEAYQLAHAIQDGFTKEEFIETMKAINESISQDLSAEDLSKVSGGGDEEISISMITKMITSIVSSWTAIGSVAYSVTYSVATGAISAAA